MQIEIHVPRPGLLLLAAVAVSGWVVALSGGGTAPTTASVLTAEPAAAPVVTRARVVEHNEGVPGRTVTDPAEGGDDTPAAVRYAEAESRARQAREEQEVLRHKEDILRAQLDQLRIEQTAMGEDVDPAVDEEFRRSALLLVDLMKDSQRADQFLRTAFNQMWEASERARALTVDVVSRGTVALLWPVDPDQGISARFLDASYEARFHMKHYAIDIPTPQLTPVYAAAGGIVKDVVDHGLGFNYVTIEHPGGYSTLYGHLTKFSVQKGQKIYAGDLIGSSGGRPGTPGAGMSTGPHLHFGVYRNGAPVDPLPFLPPAPKVPSAD